MSKKIKIIEKMNNFDIESSVNEFISDENIDVISVDIKTQPYDNDEYIYTATILYTNNDILKG